MVTNARESGARIDEAELDRAVANVAAQNQITLAQLRERLRAGRHRLRAVSQQHARPDAGRAGARARGGEPHPASATPRSTRCSSSAAAPPARARAVQHRADPGARCPKAPPRRWSPSGARAPRRRWRACAAARTSTAVAREISEDGNRRRGGEIGMRPADRLPDVFVDACAAAEGRRGRADAAAQRRRLPRPQARRAHARRGAFTVDADARAPHPAAAVARS